MNFSKNRAARGCFTPLRTWLLAILLLAPIMVKAQTTSDPIMNNILTRTSIRAYTDQPVEDEKVEAMLRAAMAAPSAGNKQPWRFVVVKDKKTLTAISDNLHTMTMAKDAPLAIIVCGDMNATFPGEGLDYWVEDASAATENLLLAAHAQGLGAVWCGIYPMQERVAFLRELLSLPEHIVPLNVVPIGYPAENPTPKDKWTPDYIHYESWAGEVPTTAEQAKPWRQIEPWQLRDNPVNLFEDAMALTVGEGDSINSMTIGWGGIGVLWGKPVVTVYVEQRRFTKHLMDQNERFTIEAFSEDYASVLQYLGTASGRNEDKITGSGLTLKFTPSGTPAFEEGRLLIECRKIYEAPFQPEGFGDIPTQVYSARPLHTVYVGEILNVWTK